MHMNLGKNETHIFLVMIKHLSPRSEEELKEVKKQALTEMCLLNIESSRDESYKNTYKCVVYEYELRRKLEVWWVRDQVFKLELFDEYEVYFKRNNKRQWEFDNFTIIKATGTSMRDVHKFLRM